MPIKPFILRYCIYGAFCSVMLASQQVQAINTALDYSSFSTATGGGGYSDTQTINGRTITITVTPTFFLAGIAEVGGESVFAIEPSTQLVNNDPVNWFKLRTNSLFVPGLNYDVTISSPTAVLRPGDSFFVGALGTSPTTSISNFAALAGATDVELEAETLDLYASPYPSSPVYTAELDYSYSAGASTITLDSSCAPFCTSRTGVLFLTNDGTLVVNEISFTVSPGAFGSFPVYESDILYFGTSVTPEPPTALFLISSLLCVGCLKRRRQVRGA